MANTHGESSVEEFAAKALPELEELLKRFNQANADDKKPEPEGNADGLSNDAERIDDLAHIIWHLAKQVEDITYHSEGITRKVITCAQVIERQLAYIKDYLRGKAVNELEFLMKRHLIKDCDAFTVTSFQKIATTSEREQAWLNHRTTGVGGSDMSAILGISHYATPLDIWLSKTGRNVPEKQDSWAIRKGNSLEKDLRQWFKDTHTDLECYDGTGLSLTSREHPHMLASLDGYLYDPATESFGVLECKTANRFRAQDWRDDDGNPRIPDYYLVQVQHYLAVTGWD